MKKRLVIFIVSFLVFIIFTLIVKYVDVSSIGPNDSKVGLSYINKNVFAFFKSHLIFYTITDWMGFIPIIVAFAFGTIGLFQLVKRKSFYKVDRQIICLGIIYLLIIFTYFFFEKCIINYRPILMSGYLEASYPSSHTMITISILGTFMIAVKRLCKKNIKIIYAISLLIIVFTVIARLISGVHWFTDIIGGILLSNVFISLYLLLEDYEA